MAYGLPVVSTSIGCEGLAVINNQHLQIADTAEALAETIGELLMDAGKRKRIGLAGYQLVQERYLWTHSQSVLLDYMATLG